MLWNYYDKCRICFLSLFWFWFRSLPGGSLTFAQYFSAHLALLLELCCSTRAVTAAECKHSTWAEHEPQLGTGTWESHSYWRILIPIKNYNGIILVLQISLVETGICYSFALAAHCNIYLSHFWKKGQILLAILLWDDSLSQKVEQHLGQNPTYFKTICCSRCTSPMSLQFF